MLRKIAGVATFLVILSVLGVSALEAQATGTVRGTVTSMENLRQLPDVQVSLQGTQMGTLTNTQGEFTIREVPPGTYALQARLIGYAIETREITVTADQTTTVDFELQRQALGLEEIIVTGAAGAAQKREIGNSVAQINTGEVDEPVTNFDNLLAGRAAGVNIDPNTGQSGGGASIRLRGNVSAAMSNQPLIYIDGVRVRSEGNPKNVPPAGYGGHGPNTAYSPLNDIDPSNIERVEIIKGAAATTLYGTEAAAGVIQIFTKQGIEGEPRWNLAVNQGFSNMYDFGPTEGVNGEPLTIPTNEKEPADASKMFLDPFLRDGHREDYSLSVNGGVRDVSYFVSGRYQDYEGVLPLDKDQRLNSRANFTINPSDNLRLDVNTSYTKTNVDQTEAGPSLGLTLNAFRRDQNYLGTSNPDSLRKTYDSDWNTYIDRFVGGITANHTASELFSQRFTLGYDLNQQETKSIRPFGHRFFPQGVAHNDRFQSEILSLDYVGNFSFDLTDQIGSRFSVGGQLIETREERVSAMGEDFPGPGIPTVSSGAIRIGFEERQRVVTGGLFLQDVLSLHERYFLTLGLRVDGNSAFGEDLGLEAYPKASLSYVISDEDFWSSDLGELKLRAAWGQSGRAPGAFDATRTWAPDGWGNQPAFMPDNVGNPELGPERTTELEAGFDHSVMDGRLTTTLTYYTQKTKDALFFVRQIPSSGFGGSQLENVGELKNEGVELTVVGRPVDRENWGVELNGTLSTNKSEVLDLGGAAPFSLGGDGWIVEGQPVPVIRGLCVRNPDAVADPEIESNCNYGPNQPTEIFSLGARVRFPHDIRLSFRGEYKGGHYAYSVMDGEAFTRGIRWPSCYNAYEHLDQGNADALTAMERARCVPSNANRDFAIYPMDFFRLRNVTLSAPLPFSVAGVNSADVVLSAQNAYFWKEAENSANLDPESGGGFLRGATGLNQSVKTVGGSIPIPAVYSVGLRVSF